MVEAFGRTKTATAADEDQHDEPGEPELQLAPVPTLGQVAAVACQERTSLPSSAPAEP